MNRKLIVILLLISLGALSACNSGYTRRNPGKNYAPDMTYSVSYDAYTYNPVTNDSMTSQKPIDGTIARGQQLPDHLKEEDSVAYKSLTNPYTFSETDIEHGKKLYLVHCGICHGSKLDGDGPLYNGGEGKYAAKPANITDPNISGLSDGHFYYVIMYGKNMMGSYGHHLNHRQRWEVIAYMRSEIGGESKSSDEPKAEEENKDDAPTENDGQVAANN